MGVAWKNKHVFTHLKWWNPSDRVQVINDCGGEEGDSIPGSVWCSRKEWVTVLTQDFLNLFPILWPPDHLIEHACVRTHFSVYCVSHSYTSKSVPQNLIIMHMIQWWVTLYTYDWWSLLDEWGQFTQITKSTLSYLPLVESSFIILFDHFLRYASLRFLLPLQHKRGEREFCLWC